MSGEAEGDGGGVVEDGEGEDAAHGAVAPAGGGEEMGEEIEAALGEEEVGFGIEEGAVGDGRTCNGGGVEGEGVVGTVAEVEGGVELLDEGGFLLGREVAVGVVGVEVKLVGEGFDALGLIAGEDVDRECGASEGAGGGWTGGFGEVEGGEGGVVVSEGAGGAFW